MTNTPYDLDMPELRELQRMEDAAMGLIQSFERKERERESDGEENFRFTETAVCCLCGTDTADDDDDAMDIEDKSDDGNCLCRERQGQDRGKQQQWEYQQQQHQHQHQQGPDDPFDQRGLDLGYENNGNIEGSGAPSQSISSTTDSNPDGNPNRNLPPTITDHHNHHHHHHHQQNPPRATRSVQQEADEQSNSSSPSLHLPLNPTTAREQSPNISLHLRGGGPSRKTLSSHRCAKEAGVGRTSFHGSGGGSDGARQTYIGSGTRDRFLESLGRVDEDIDDRSTGEDDNNAGVSGGEDEGSCGEEGRGRRGRRVVVFDRRDWRTRWEVRDDE